jgi:uncharacterized membrane protein
MDLDYLNDWLAFLLRWLHVIASIVWIGTSFYFVALDKHLRPPKRTEPEGVAGEAWEIHGGGFYRVEKYRVAPARLPEPLYWFKWEAYTTWLSGFALLVVLYYVHADVYLVDRSVADLSELEATAISIALLVAAVAVYEVLYRLLKERELWLAAALLVAVAAAAYGVSNLFSGRGTYLQLGAMLGTIMAANVLFVIIPGHWELVRAKQAGREPDPAPGIEGKRRSVHNNYLTLPVLLAMISIHFPTAYAHEHAWAVLVALMVVGAWVRHFFNLRHEGRTVWWIPATAALGVAALAVAIAPDETAAPAARGPVQFSQVRAIVASRCAECHSAHPTNEAFSTPPAGVVFDTPAQIAARADAIDEQAVRTKAMPLGNVTGMTEEERGVLAAWIDAGAPTR